MYVLLVLEVISHIYIVYLKEYKIPIKICIILFQLLNKN